MPAPLLSDILPDFVDELAALMRDANATPLIDQLAQLRIESVCDCGDANCSSFATSREVKVANTVELPAMEGFLIIDLNPEERICFIEVLNRPDVKYLIEEYYVPESGS